MTNLIIGQSGSGKTVLMKSLVGLHTPDSGEILYDGRNLLAMDGKQRKELRKEIGMLFQGRLVVGVSNTDTLNSLIKKIITIKGVKDVKRNN